MYMDTDVSKQQVTPKRRHPCEITEFTENATGPDPEPEKSSTRPLTPLQETKDNSRRDAALFKDKRSVVCREIFSKSARPDYL